MSAPRDPFGLTGTTVDGKVRVEHVVGEGGFGVVYRAVHEGFGVPVALKCLKLPPYLDADAQDDLIHRLREEGRLLLKLSQRTTGILQALDVGAFVTPGGARVPYLVLEWLEGHTLSEEMSRLARAGSPALGLREAMRLLEPAAKALAVAHEERIAHRDIKPDNLFIVELGATRTMKVLDFGIAKVFAEAPTPDRAATGAFPSAFTPAYGAPEQFDKHHGATGPWTDVFSLALVLVELVTGSRALVGDTLAQLFLASVDPVRRPTPRARGLGTTDEVEDVFASALEVDRARRIQSAGELWAALEGALARSGELVPSRPLMLVTDEIASAPTIAAIAANDETREPESETREPERARDPVASAPRASSPPTAPSAVDVSSPRGLRPIAWGLGLTAVLAGVVVLVARTWSNDPQEQSPSAARSVSSTPTTASAAVVSRSPEADGLYREAMRAWRDGEVEPAVSNMEKAVEVDRELGAGHLRLALWTMSLKDTEARHHYQSALRQRDGLAPADRALLEAAEPFVRQPWDLDAWTKGLEELHAAAPNDNELRVLLGQARYARLDFEGAVAIYDQALASSPDLPIAWIERGEAQSMQGDVVGQLASYDRCLEARAGSAECLAMRVLARGRLGQCESMRDDARTLMSRAPSLVRGPDLLASALLATGERGPAVEETLALFWSLLPPDRRRVGELEDRAAIAVLDGNFDDALRLHDEWLAAVAGKRDPFARGLPALRKARLLEELGEPRRAGELAMDFLERMKALPEAIGGDMSIHFVGVAARAGALSPEELTRRRAAWLERYRTKWSAAGRRTDLDFEWIAWSTAYGGEVRSVKDAEEAKREMPKERPLAVESGRWTGMDLNVGRVLVLTGEPEKALAPLRRAANSCHLRDDATRGIVAQLHLGMALEAVGKHVEARGAYERVVGAWGAPKSLSKTAEAARRALGGLPAP